MSRNSPCSDFILLSTKAVQATTALGFLAVSVERKWRRQVVEELAQLGLGLQKHHGFLSSPITAPPLVGSHSHLYPAGLANLPFLLLGEHTLLQRKGRPRQTAGSERAGEAGISRGQLSCMVPEGISKRAEWCH